MSYQDELSAAEERLKQLRLRRSLFRTKGKRATGEVGPLSIAIDLVSSIMVGLLIGFWLDKFFDSKPICMIIFLFIGSLAGGKIIWQKLNIKNK